MAGVSDALTGDVTALYLAGPGEEFHTRVGCAFFYVGGYEENGYHYSTYWPHQAFFCPECGVCWARIHYDYHFKYTPVPIPKWQVRIQRCEDCGDGTLLTGSLDEVSIDLLERELNVLLTIYEKGLK